MAERRIVIQELGVLAGKFCLAQQRIRFGKTQCGYPSRYIDQHPETGGNKKTLNMKYTVILEKGASSHGAFVPDLPVCIAVGETKEEALRLIGEAIEFHIQGLLDAKEEIPRPRCDFAQVEVKLP
uniref:Predicted nuclease of the RNAse H fold, HicB family n=1 Tax=Candidatus Kentrum sp. LFY TaxID=2126342 RepID=A0A450UQ57_9GAMM|nr:MAG: Predicted nuclease of the RNAse H fold, HicB family [Candidatus Kentron sp. LFY]